MPELPEVETLVRGLRDQLVGRSIIGVEIDKPKMWQGLPSSTLTNHAVTNMTRIAKLMVFSLSDNLSLLIHLKMTGQLIFVAKDGQKILGGHPDNQFAAEQPSKYTHITFSFSDGSKLFFNDMRQFGYAKLIHTNDLQQHKHIVTVGIDPFSSEFTAQFLFAQLQKRPKTTIKQVLMDQTVIGGLGNIYTDESLFDAKILPMRAAASITKEEANVLHASIIKILETGIQYGGTSYKDYVHHNGQKGTMQDHLMVCRRHGQACKVCGHALERTVIGGRGTHFCRTCQK